MDRYLITGATGLIGSMILKRLAEEDGIELVCPVRSESKAKMLLEDRIYNKVKWFETSMEEFLANLDGCYDYIIHCASPTSSKFFVEHPVETLQFSIRTTMSLLDYCKRHTIKGMVYLSSLESYGSVLGDSKPLDEEFQGYVNPMEVRSSYNMAKRMCESLCHAYAKEYNVPVKVIRLTQTVSPYISESDMRVFAQFARHAAKGENIELHTDGSSARQYIHINDAVNAILCVLYYGESGEAYNAAREDSYISVMNLAQFVQDHFNPQGKVVFHRRDDLGYAPTTKLKLDVTKLHKLGWRAEFDLYGMFKDIICHPNNQSSNE